MSAIEMQAPSFPDAFPIMEVAAGVIQAVCADVSTEGLESLNAALGAFIAGRMDFLDMSRLFEAVPGGIKALKKIIMIIRPAEAPIPADAIERKAPSGIEGRRWAEYEDERLLAGLYRFGMRNWEQVAAFVGNNRTKPQCIQRWSRALNPTIKKSKWTEQEDRMLVDLVKNNPSKSWSYIASRMANRSDVQCRYYWKKKYGERSPVDTDTPDSTDIEPEPSQRKAILKPVRSFLDAFSEYGVYLLN